MSLSESAEQRAIRLAEARERLIVALDVPSQEAALELAGRLEGVCRWVKVGLELFVAAGPGVVEALAGRGFSVFLDLKLHDIPNTVAAAVKSAGGLGARMLTVHGLGGPVMLRAAVEAAQALPLPLEVLAVTVLTSMDQAQVSAVGLVRTAREQVELLGQLGVDAGLRGFVCSAQEVGRMRELTGAGGVLVIPGIRPAGAALGDQQRVATPAQALRDGASYLVVGRPITQAPEPAAAAAAIVAEMAGA